MQTTVDGCIVLLGIEDGKYYSLNRTASEIWNLLENPSGIGEIKQRLGEIFETPVSGLEDSIMESLDYFEKRQLIEKVEPN